MDLQTIGRADLQMTGPVDLQTSGRADLQMTDPVDLQTIVRVGLRMTGRADLRMIGPVDLRMTGRADLRITGPVDLQAIGRADLQTIVHEDLRTSHLGERRREVVDRRRAIRRRVAAASARVAAILCMCSPFVAVAADDAAIQSFESGRAAFEQQDYLAALESFESALNAGMTGPAVHFNIGVAAYRSQRYERANIAFMEVARTPAMAPLAHYNLGLVALAIGDRDAATRWFTSAQSTATDERLRGLASTQLSTLAPQRSSRNWLAYGAVSAGYDDNVALVSNSSVLGVSDLSDYFTDVQLAFSAPLDRPWRFDAGLFMLDYLELNRFDQWGVSGGARYRVPMGSWSHELGLQSSYTTLDDEGMESRYTFGLMSRTTLPLEWQLRARYRISSIDGLEEFERLSGKRHEIDARVYRLLGPWDVLARYQYDINDYDDKSLSSTRHFVEVDVGRALTQGWTAQLELSWRRSDYELDASGTEHRTEGALSVIRTLSSRWRLIVRYAYADNDSDLAEYAYQRSRISATVEAIY